MWSEINERWAEIIAPEAVAIIVIQRRDID